MDACDTAICSCEDAANLCTCKAKELEACDKKNATCIVGGATFGLAFGAGALLIATVATGGLACSYVGLAILVYRTVD